MLKRAATLRLGYGQVALELDEPITAPVDQVRDLIRLSDPALSELEFDELLDELLIRVRDLLRVDTAAILLVDEDEQQLTARAAKGIEEEVERGVQIPIGTGFAGRIALERVAIFIADVDHADIMNPILREKGIRSLLGVPLIVEGELIGVLHVGSLHPRTFDLRDLAVLELAAARAAPAIERGRLIGALAREHQNAMVLQRSLIPRRLGSADGLTIAARYMPARAEVGGDWYDVIELPQGKVGIVIGDVVGHGLLAAALMGQLRSALRAYALEGNGPGRTLELLDRFASNLDDDAMATVAYGVVDSWTGNVTVASAGHLPPILISPGEEARAAELAVAPPIGAFGYKRCPESELAIAPSEMLMFYTDGLIERPGLSLTVRIDELADVVRTSLTAEDACLLAMDRMVPGPAPPDDIAVIVVQNEPTPATFEMKLPAYPDQLARLRLALGRWLRAQQLDREIENEITIAVSEASANAIEHAYGPSRGQINVAARAGEGWIEVTVRDHGHWRVPRGEHRGRGLKIMRAAMDAVEIERHHDGTTLRMRRNVR